MNMRGNGSAGTRAVRNRDIDIALVRRATGGSGYRADPLRHDHFVAVLPRGHRHAADLDDDPFDLDALATEPWVWIPRDISPGYHDEVVAACRRAGFSPDARHQANSIATQLAMVSCGIGVASYLPWPPAGTMSQPARCWMSHHSSRCRCWPTRTRSSSTPHHRLPGNADGGPEQ
jgi:DNA-binding transcriptional LysR family regulator